MELKHVSKNYGDTVALRDVTLSLARGEITAILGESGAGKTTLLNAVGGFISHGGEIEGAGRVSCVFQDEKLLPHLTAAGNLQFVLPKSEWGKIGEMLSGVGLAGKENRRPRELSGGERRRLSIARALLFPHDTLLMDEPFSALDLSLKKSLVELVARLLKERGDTALFVTHDVHEAALLADRAIVLREGEVAYETAIDGPYPRDFFVNAPVERELMRALMRGEMSSSPQ